MRHMVSRDRCFTLVCRWLCLRDCG